MCTNSASPRPAVRAKLAPSPWAAKVAASCWCSTGRESLASKCDLREDGTSGNCTFGRTADPKCKFNTSYTTERGRLHSLASSCFQSFGGATAHWPKREVPTHELEWLKAPLLHRKRALVVPLRGALLISLRNGNVLEELAFWPRVFQARGL